MSTSGFVKDREILEETHKVEDLLHFTDEIMRLKETIDRIPYSALIGYIGKFGTGKSTAIYQLRKAYEDVRWFEFDAWKYPDRKDLWEGFVLDIADQLGDKKKTTGKIDGKTSTSKTVRAIAQIAQFAGVATGLSFIAEKFSYLFEGQRIERVFEIQGLLNDMLSTVTEDEIFIVVEDIDRSGDAGKYFLETLKQFVKNNTSKKRIVVIVPIGEEVYEQDIDLQASYYKSLDHILYFEPKNTDYSGFIDMVFDESVFPKDFQSQPNVAVEAIWKVHLEEWFQLASGSLTIREIKATIREANIHYRRLYADGYEPDPRIMLALTLLTKIKTDGGKRWISKINTNNPIQGSCPIYPYLQSVAKNMTLNQTSQKGYVLMDTKFIQDKRYTIPVINNAIGISEKDVSYILSDFYLIPFGIIQR